MYHKNDNAWRGKSTPATPTSPHPEGFHQSMAEHYEKRSATLKEEGKVLTKEYSFVKNNLQYHKNKVS